jgi:flagellar biosynthesis/type III secretory pathway M-ring protein FliF/YscJ
MAAVGAAEAMTIQDFLTYFVSQGPWAIVAIIVGRHLMKKYEEAEKRAAEREAEQQKKHEEREGAIELKAEEREQKLIKQNDEREQNYQSIIEKLTDKYDIVIDKIKGIESHLGIKEEERDR